MNASLPAGGPVRVLARIVPTRAAAGGRRQQNSMEEYGVSYGDKPALGGWHATRRGGAPPRLTHYGFPTNTP
jgi:hypothetical protein